MATKTRTTKGPLPECTVFIKDFNQCLGDGSYFMEWTLCVLNHREAERREVGLSFPLDSPEEVVECLAELHALGANVDGVTDIDSAWDAADEVFEQPVALRKAPGDDCRCAGLAVNRKKWKPKARQLRALAKEFGPGKGGEEADAASRRKVRSSGKR